jgi:hypothetical protein
MTLRSDIHAALDAVTPAAPHLPSSIVAAVLVAPSRRPRRGRVASLSLIGGAVVVLLAVLAVVGLGLLAGAPGRTIPASTPPPRPAALVITKWVKDPSVVNGPWPGYRPQMVLAYRGTLASVRAARDPGGGNDWVLEFTLDPEGTQVLGSLTKDAVVACSGFDCPERHIGNWLDLTQDDVDHWNERAMSEYRPVSQGGKLISDPYVTVPITNGQGHIQGNFSHQEATDLARRLGGK